MKKWQHSATPSRGPYRKQAMWHRVQTSSRPSFLAMEPIFMAQDHNDTQSLVTITGNPHQKNIKILDTISSSPMCICCEVIPHLKHLDTFQPCSYLVGGFNPSEKIWVNGKDYPIYEMEKKHVPNHQPVNQMFICSSPMSRLFYNWNAFVAEENSPTFGCWKLATCSWNRRPTVYVISTCLAFLRHSPSQSRQDWMGLYGMNIHILMIYYVMIITYYNIYILIYTHIINGNKLDLIME